MFQSNSFKRLGDDCLGGAVQAKISISSHKFPICILCPLNLSAVGLIGAE